MAKSEWGNKHICANCGGRFYDMKKTPAVCPKCGTVEEVEKRKSKKKPAAREAVEAVPTPAKSVKKAPVADDDDALIDDDEEDLLLADDDEDDDDFDDLDDELIEDASDLGDEDDDLSEAKEHLEDDAT